MAEMYKGDITNSLSDICPVCLMRSVVVLRPYRGHSDLFVGTSIMRCEQCKLVFASPMPSVSEWEEYNASYADNAHGGLNLSPGALNFFSGIALLRLQHVLSYCESVGKQIGSVLEIGPGHGFFCQHLLEKLPFCQYCVVESDDVSAQRLLDLGAVVYRGFDELEKQGESFDLLVMSHVLEHSIDPHAFLGSAASYLVEGGVIFLEVPCRDYEFKEEDEPHLLFFDKPSMERLLERLSVDNAQLTYHGKEIRNMKPPDRVTAFAQRVLRAVQRRTGIGQRSQPPFIKDRDVWNAVASHDAHTESQHPSWWLRAMATKIQSTLD